jgi:hypothetical protein
VTKVLVPFLSFALVSITANASVEPLVVKQASCSVKVNNKVVGSVQLASNIREISVVEFSHSDGTVSELQYMIDDGGIQLTPLIKKSYTPGTAYSSPNKAIQLFETLDDSIYSECSLVIGKQSKQKKTKIVLEKISQ